MSKWSPFWMPGRSTPRTRTKEALCEANRALGFSTPRRCISSINTARCGDGSGSLPVPCNPVTQPTASMGRGTCPSDWPRRRPTGRACRDASAGLWPFPPGFASAWPAGSTSSIRPETASPRPQPSKIWRRFMRPCTPSLSQASCLCGPRERRSRGHGPPRKADYGGRCPPLDNSRARSRDAENTRFPREGQGEWRQVTRKEEIGEKWEERTR